MLFALTADGALNVLVWIIVVLAALVVIRWLLGAL